MNGSFKTSNGRMLVSELGGAIRGAGSAVKNRPLATGLLAGGFVANKVGSDMEANGDSNGRYLKYAGNAAMLGGAYTGIKSLGKKDGPFSAARLRSQSSHLQSLAERAQLNHTQAGKKGESMVGNLFKGLGEAHSGMADYSEGVSEFMDEARNAAAAAKEA